MTSLTRQLADFVAETRYEDLPQEVAHEAQRVILDSIGCALGGMAVEKGRLSAGLARRLGGTPESSILGTREKVSCTGAAFANGELINALDFDAVLLPAIHVAPFVLPPALALGESRGSSGRDVILAAVLGHELSARIASGMSGMRTVVKEWSERGKVEWLAVHGYSVNAFGSAAGAGKVMGLDGEGMANALGIAGYNAPMQAGAQWHSSGTNALVKYASAGWIAQVGTTAVLLAEAGYTGDVSVLEGDHSFWRFAGSERWRPEKVARDLRQKWCILDTAYKLYPCCGIINGSLDCFTAILGENSLAPGDIERVEVLLDPLSHEPLWQSRRIENEVQAQFSVPYVFAMSALGLELGAEWQEPGLRGSPGVAEFMDKVIFADHPDYGKAALDDPGAQMSRVDVRAGGKTYSRETRVARGSAVPETYRLSDGELEEKFRHNVSRILSHEGTDKAISTIWELTELQDIAQLTTVLAG